MRQCIDNVKKKGIEEEEEEVEEVKESGQEVENRKEDGELPRGNLELKALPAGSSTSSATPITVVCTPNTSDSESESESESSPAESISRGRANPKNNNIDKMRVSNNIAHGGSDFSCTTNLPAEPRPCLNITALSVSIILLFVTRVS